MFGILARMQSHHVIILGGGFAGIRAALQLQRNQGCRVTLISKNPNFEYYPGLHKVVSISRRPTVEVPLETIFKGTAVEVVVDTITGVDAHQKTVSTASKTISGDSIIFALGSQTEFFNIEGLEDMAYGFKSVAEACRLRTHIEEMFAKHIKTDKAETVVGLHVVVVGAGPNGVDLAGELAALGHELAKKYGIAQSLLTIDLIEGASRVLPMMPEHVSEQVENRLRLLGVNVLCNRDLRKQDSWTVALGDMTIGTKTLIWTAGVTTNELVKSVAGFQLGKKNRVAVDDYLQAKGFDNVFVVGDSADTPYAGLAQTALYDAEYVAGVISAKNNDQVPRKYQPHAISYVVGVGHRWSVLVSGKFAMFGFLPYVLRTIIDIKFFLSILPVGEVWRLYRKGHKKP
jgi:NADH dehydrogenase